jgi:hypothetical protein
MWPFKRTYPDKQSLVLIDSWSVSQGRRGANPMIVRLNRGVAAAVGHPAFTHQVGVAVPLHAPDAHGFPAADEAAQLDAIEDLLVSRLTIDRQCIQAATISTGGMREFVFYSSAPPETHEALQALAREVATHQLQHIIQPDPSWRTYRRFS